MDGFRTHGSVGFACPSDLSLRDRQGKRQVQTQKRSSKFSSDSSSCHSDAFGKDTLTSEHRQRSSHKSLLAQEMAKENESKRRSPSIIARLMGLDGLPPQNPSHKQPKSLENRHKKLISLEKAERSCTFHGHRSFRKSSNDEQEFKDVFEVIDTPKVDNSRFLSQRSGSANLTEAEMAFIRQKFMEAKRLSTDEKLQNSREFHDALEALDSNKDLLLRYLQHPDSLFAKHLQDLQSVVPELQCGHVSSVRPFNGQPKREKSITRQKTKTETLQKNQSKSPSCFHARQVAYNNTLETPKTALDEKHGLQPTRIVVLKPNLDKTRNVDTTLSSPSSSSDYFRADSRLPCARNREAELWREKKVDGDASLTRHNSREIARKITTEMRTRCSKRGSMNFQASGFRGYAGDESSSGSDTESEPELVKLYPIATFNRRNKYRSLSSRSTESSVSREAKKRLSERWTLTHKSEKVGEISRSSTLAEMLTISDRGARPASFDGVVFEEGLSKMFETNNGQNELTEPLGISSRDGWKEGCIRILPRPRSLLASSSASGSPRTIKHCENLRDYKIVMPNEVPKRERNKSVLGRSLNRREAFLSSNSRPSRKKSQSSCSNSPERIITPRQDESLFMDDQFFEKNLSTSEAHTSFSLDVNSDTENVANAGDVKRTVFSERSHLDLLASTSLNDPKSGHDVLRPQDLSGGSSRESFHSSVPEIQSPASAKEGDQPSPVSVLETSVAEEFTSSPEFFESLSADLHGLRMQLQRLKRESGAYEEGGMLVSSDEEVGLEESTGLTDEMTITQQSEETWKSLYLIDVFVSSRFSDADPDAFMATWHSSESPVSPTLFEELEKKYSNLGSSSRCKRKFLFDHINWEVLEIFKQFADPHPWVKPARVGPRWDMNELQDTLRELVTKKDEKVNERMGEMVLQSESEWLNLEENVEVIGREIERLLTDELIAEIAVTI